MDYYGPMSLPKRLFRQFTLAFMTAIACMGAMAADDTPPVNNSAMDADLFYKLLLGALSAQNGDPGTAFALTLDSARKTHSEQLYEKAVGIALNARDGESALSATRAWSQDLTNSASANRYLLQILVALNRIGDTVEPIRHNLSLAKGTERAANISQLPRYFARATDKKQAATVVETALNADLSNKATGASAWAAVGTMRLMAGNTDGALNAAKRSLQFNAQSEELATLALDLWDAKQPQTDELAQQLLVGKPKAEFLLGYARRLASADRLTQALAVAQRTTREYPSHADGWLVQGTLEFQNKKLDAAESSLKHVIQLREKQAPGKSQDTTLVQTYWMLSQLAEQRKQPDQALGYLQKIEGTHDVLRVGIRKATLLAQQGKLAEARTLVQGLPETQAQDAQTKISAEVQFLRSAKQHTQVYDVLSKAATRFQDDVEWRYELAMAAEKIGKVQEMEDLLRQVIAAKPDYHHAYNALGYSMADRNVRLPEARQLIVKALEFAPKDPFIMDSLGWLEFRSGNLAAALDVLSQAYKARPDAEIAAHLGEVLWAMGRKDEAKARWNEGLASSPDNETLRETIQRLNKP